MSDLTATAFAPATCGNLCVGYDVLGLCYEGVGDTVTVTRIDEKKVVIESIEPDSALPLEAEKNTAGIVLIDLIEKEELNHGFSVKIEKGISLGSGMGGSAASAVGALVAANSLLENPLTKEELLEYSLKGEELACGHGHADNTAPCLFGGVVLLTNGEVVEVPFPEDIYLLLIHPHLTVKTADARAVVKSEYSLSDYVQQSQNLSGFIAACFSGNKSLMKKCFKDVLVEPLRAPLTEGFIECRDIAKKHNVIGYALSGSGPSQVALCESQEQALSLKDKLEEFYSSKNIEVDTYVGTINTQGARIE